MTEHTLTVSHGDIWDVRDDGNPGVPLFRADYQYRRWGRDVSRQEKEQLAVRVVHCVNSHDALVAALEQAQGVLADLVCAPNAAESIINLYIRAIEAEAKCRRALQPTGEQP